MADLPDYSGTIAFAASVIDNDASDGDTVTVVTRHW